MEGKHGKQTNSQTTHDDSPSCVIPATPTTADLGSQTRSASQVGARHLMVFGPSAATAAQLLEEELEMMASGRHVAVVVGSSFPRDRSVGASLGKL